MRLTCGVIEYHSAQAMVALGLALAMVLAGWQLAYRIEEDSFLMIDSCTYMHASRSSTRDINNASMFGITSEHARKRGVIMCNIVQMCILFPAILLCINSQFAIKRISHSKPDLRYCTSHKLSDNVCIKAIDYS